jgi:hypothetical protein
LIFPAVAQPIEDTMSLLGEGVVAIWNDITPEGRVNFIDWHNREHIPERVAIPGFHRGRRYIAKYGDPEYFTLYEARDTAVLVGAPYLERLNNPTPWTKSSTAHFRSTVRGVCSRVYSEGTGEGAFMLTLRFDVDPERAQAFRSFLVGEGLPPLERLTGISGIHLCIADEAASGLETAERKGRSVGAPNWIVMIEGAWMETVDQAVDLLLKSDIASMGCLVGAQRGLYQLEFSRVDPAPFVSATAG